MTASPSVSAGTIPNSSDRSVGLWLLSCCAMILAMAVIGAITRLTESGLSIMEWAPIGGTLPPLSDAEWQRVFALYRQIPEYQQVNAGMSLEEFKTIFWWEYIHRLWGRLIGVVFAVPFIWFLIRGKLRRDLIPHLIAMFLLGGLQGGLGWYMVASGFADRTDVSQYRLTAHLLLAIVIYAYILWVALRLLVPAPPPSPAVQVGGLRRSVIALIALLLVTIASGGFVAGLNAGMIYNTFPLMDGDWIPSDYGALSPFTLNFFENIAAVQFNHRALAMICAAAVLGLWIWSRRLALSDTAQNAFTLLLAGVVAQVILGISTLLLVVPIWLGALHQAGAILLLSLAFWVLHHLRAAPVEQENPGETLQTSYRTAS
ncbi:COX15/CtaA family protein [Denitrobaculum tricleocarpae]|uniref:Heme A synthase n=1 Tax=Denitrobaculum tricleocarpae TaxID=2591009 RepID=A0A545T7W0_9PROT|nr:COX15/CtaA family protein [Denitrobaculum tricleocarpae]TQV73313.1 heme A synthase [Denitrobaculum tricleocarpae]